MIVSVNKVLIINLLFLSLTTLAQTPAFDLNKKLGRGINMGNMFEAPTETDWGNPFKDDYFQRIATLGFNHVRIPIRWDTPARTLQTEPYTIDKTFLERIKYVVDKALSQQLYVVINMHHHNDIFDTPDKVKPRFLAQWQQIATFFKDYDNRVLFEVMNEPNTNLTPDKWNVFFADALTEIRKTNKTRAVLMGTASWGGLGGVSSLKIPKDDNLILTIHYYDPFNFTHQGADWVNGADKWLGTKWENTNLERDEVANAFQYAINFAKQNNLPIHIGEFGAYNKADIDSRVRWANFLARWFEQQGFSWAYWEFSAGFGIYNPTSNTYLTSLVDALLKTPMQPPLMLNTQKIYESKFDASDNGWFLNLQQGANATMTKNSGTATIDVSKATTENWHVQLVLNNISLKKNYRYLVSFDGMAAADVAVSNYLGQASGSYKSYSGYKNFTLTNNWQGFSYSFVMQDDDDPKARIAFDLGAKATKISLKNVIVQEVQPLATGLEIGQVAVYPNPTTGELRFSKIGSFKKIILFDLYGRELMNIDLNGESEKQISLKNLNARQVLVVLQNEKESISRKVLLEYKD